MFLKLVPALTMLAATTNTGAQEPGAAPAAGQRASEPARQPAPLAYVPGSLTFVVLPDTQIYAEDHPELLEQQTRWIAAQRAERNIACVFTVGDLTNRNRPEQWDNVRRAFKHLDGVVPYILVTGNHDYGREGTTDSRETGLHRVFDPAEHAPRAGAGGLMEPGRLDNSYHLFNAGGHDWLVLALEWGPRDAVVAWADTVLREHAERRAIVLTHAYLYSDNTRYDHIARPTHKWNPHAYATAKLPGGTSDGEELWNKLVARHDNVEFVLCGHVLNSGTGLLSSTTPGGQVVHQVMANYQERPQGGEGYLRLMEFPPDGATVRVRTFSPVLDRYLTDPTQQFILELRAPRGSR